MGIQEQNQDCLKLAAALTAASSKCHLVLVVVALELVLHVVDHVLGGLCGGVAWRVLRRAYRFQAAITSIK